MGEHSFDLLLLNPNVVTHREDGASVGTIGVPDDYIVRCINAGILSIATWLDALGARVRVLDFLDDPDLTPLTTLLARERPLVIGISVMTAFAYPHARRLAAEARRLCPEAMIVLGGQHVGPFAERCLDDVPEADVVARYEGEEVCRQLLEVARGREELEAVHGIAWRRLGSRGGTSSYPRQVPLEEIPPLRYELYPNFTTFLPYVEESRGCFARCAFCITPFTNEYSIRGKSAERLLQEVDHARDCWGPTLGGKQPLALLASTFGAQPREATRLMEGLRARGYRWTSEFRADGPFARRLKFVADCGARALFVGVESCSPEQLVRMKKTQRPGPYLERLSELVQSSREASDVLVKLGLLFYIGESRKTQRETLGWLFSHADLIRWVSVSPLFVFGGTPLEREFPQHQVEHGARLHATGFWSENRIFACHVSREFSFQDTVEAARYTEKLFRQPEAFDTVFERRAP